MAADAVGKGEISFEIRLPHDIGLLLFKTLDMGCSLTCFLADEMVACEDVVERPHAGQVFVPHVFHDLMELFCAQRRILPAKLNDARFHLRCDTASLCFGRTALI